MYYVNTDRVNISNLCNYIFFTIEMFEMFCDMYKLFIFF